MVEKNSDAGLSKYHWVNCAVDIVFLMFRPKMMSTQNSTLEVCRVSVVVLECRWIFAEQIAELLAAQRLDQRRGLNKSETF